MPANLKEDLVMALISQRSQETKAGCIMSWSVIAVLCMLVVWLVLMMVSTPPRPVSREKSLAAFDSFFSPRTGVREEPIGILEVVRVEPFPQVGLVRVTAEEADGENFVIGLATVADNLVVGSKVKLLKIGVSRSDVDDVPFFKPTS